MNCRVEWTGPDDPKEDLVEPKLVDVRLQGSDKDGEL